MIGNRQIFISIILLLTTAISASGVTVSSSVDKNRVALGDPITLSVSVVGEGGSTPDPILPDLSSFEVYSSGKNTSISIVNGKFSSTLEVSYVLIPKKMGKLTIGPVSVKENNSVISSDPIKIEVLQPGTASQSPTQKKPTESVNIPNRTENFFIEQVVNKRRPYVGEQVTLTFRFYAADRLWEQPDLEWPDFNGFTIEDLPPVNRYAKIINNKRYTVTEIKRALFPITSGDIVIESPRLVIKEDIFDNFMDPFNMFRRGRRRTTSSGPQVLTADRLKMSVRPLPTSGKPVDFAGAVGKYRINATVDKDSVGIDEPITLKTVLSGTGNIKSLPAVSIPDMPDFRVYESGKNESINNNGGVVSGSKTFEQAIIPVTSGNFSIPPIKFSFFNPESRKYQTISTNAIDIIASGEALEDIAGAPKNIIGTGQKSFAYIITEFSAPYKQNDIYAESWFWLLQVVPVVGVGIVLVLSLRNRKMLGDRAYARRLLAGKNSRALFKSAFQMKDKGDIEGFYGELYSSLVGFIADRLNLEKSALTIEDIRNMNTLDSEFKGRLLDFLDKSQVARFAPGSNSNSGMEDSINEASELLKHLEKTL